MDNYPDFKEIDARQTLSQGVQSQSLTKDSADLLRWQMNQNLTLAPLRLKLMGLVRYKNAQGEIIIERVRKPMVNDICVDDIMNELDSVVNKDTMMAILTNEQYKMIMWNCMTSLNGLIFTREHLYRLDPNVPLTDAEMTEVHNMVERFLMIILSKAIDGKYLGFLKEQYERRDVNTIVPEKKNGLFGLKGFNIGGKQ